MTKHPIWACGILINSENAGITSGRGPVSPAPDHRLACQPTTNSQKVTCSTETDYSPYLPSLLPGTTIKPIDFRADNSLEPTATRSLAGLQEVTQLT